ncbi:low temperature requirement protein A [Micromonospora orduensis]|uniref:Low temperature requirement protein A n=2 Tax=Micromonospora orduensis TaxID=1420891 RepID=A0A5C4QGC4_9ACTN|nr:low temperature requirement protein A [Micromonospora orduensis]TNH23503.1 low temperature requirement protein A [Micromonospora orduensis]
MSDTVTHPAGLSRTWYRPMVARPTDEPYRTVTPLELLFDLCFVAAVRQAADRLHHNLGEADIGHGIDLYPAVFFAIWWAWMNFTTFASAYDPEDDVYRLTTLVQIAGALVIAGGVPRAFDHGDFSVITYGYVIMRLAMVGQWLRVAHSDPERRATALRYAVGITVLQAAWIARLALPDRWLLRGFLVIVLAELLLPFWARRPAPIIWHPRHITERYGLFTLIVLGESILAASLAVQTAFDRGIKTSTLLSIAGAAVVIVFAMWWLYFDRPVYQLASTPRVALLWGYGQYLIFASAAALGAGIAVDVDYQTGAAHLGRMAAGYAVATPVAIYLLAVWTLHIRPYQQLKMTVPYLATTALVLLTPFTPAPARLTALLLATLVATTVIGTRRRQGAGGTATDH